MASGRARNAGRSCLYFGRIPLGRHMDRPGNRLARSSRFRRHTQPIALETAVRLGGALDHLDHDDRLVALDKLVASETTPPQRAVALVVIEALGAGIADEGGGAVDFLAVAVAFDHRAAHFLGGLPVYTGNRVKSGLTITNRGTLTPCQK